MSIIGREHELALADLFLDDAAQRFSVLDVHGEAGIGKTTVLKAVLGRAEARGFQILTCRPTVAEAKLSFAGITDLLEGVPEDAFADLSPPQRLALDVALLRAEPGDAAVDRRTVGVAIRSLVRGLAVRRPILVVIDDLQWLDAASAATLQFALRRLDNEAIGVLAARRAKESTRLEIRNLEPAFTRSLAIGPLSIASLHHLLRRRLGHVPSRSVLVRVAEASRGNPLFALEIGRLLAENGAPPAGEPLPVPAEVDELVRRRTASLPRRTREVLLAATALSNPTEEIVRAALRRSIVADLDPAERREIARLERGAIAFAHPLFAGAIYASATAADRRGMHRRLAEVVAASEERARHLALAADGRDEAAAAAAHAAAAAAAARGAPAAAAELAELALALTEPQSDRECLRLLDLAEYLQAAGESERALALLEAVDSWKYWPPNLHARAVDFCGQLMSYTRGPTAMAEFARHALRESLPTQVRAAAHLALSYSASLCDAESALQHADTALALLEPLDEEDVDVAVAASALALRLRAGAVLSNGLDRDLVDRVRALESHLAPTRGPTAPLGGWFRWIDDLHTSRDLLERDLEHAVGSGNETLRAIASMTLALTECVAGQLDRAHEHAFTALELAQELDLGEVANLAADALALVEATLGHADEVHELLNGRESTRRAGAVLGLLELSRENYAAADAHLRSALDLFEHAGLREPGIDRMHADAAEAAVALGDVERAERLADFLEQHGERTGRRWSLATGARVRALVAAARGDLDVAVAACDRALHHHVGLPMPLERARTLLTKGVIERRLRRRRLAKLAFDEALALFEQAGAALWAERTRAELARLGLRRTAGDELTEAERRIAELTASGLTRRGVAAALHVSPKTVEATLGRVYRKLGIASRAELGARMVELQK